MNEPGPYQPPRAHSTDDQTRLPRKTAAEKILFSIGLLGAFVTALIATVVVPQFNEVFGEFGADLPLLSLLVANFYGLAWLLPLVPIAAWFVWPNQRRRGRIAAWMAIAIPLLGLPLLIIALYLPVFGLAAAI